MNPQIDYQQLTNTMLATLGLMGQRQKGVPSSTPSALLGHGNGGLFSGAGLSQELFSAMILPGLGLQSVLPAFPSLDTNPLVGIITGVTATSGSEPTGVCDDPPTVGVTKLCTQSHVFGRVSRQTPVFDITKIGLRTNRGEFQDFTLYGNPFNSQLGGGAAPTIPGMGMSAANVGRNELAKALFEFGVGWTRDFATDLYEGNPSNNTAGGGREYYWGLNSLINTGYRDAITLQACPAADSIVRSFGGLAVNDQGAQLVRVLSNIWRNLNFIAAKTRLTPVRWTLAMTYGMFYEITEQWPCAYHSYRCQLADGTTNFLRSEEDQNRLRDDMRGNMDDRTGQYLLIDGVKVPVTLDDAIAETVGEGETFTSTIYFVPLTVLGSRPVTYFEYIPFDAQNGAMDFAKFFAPTDFYFTTDSGRFIWHKKPTNNWCVQFMALSSPRVLLRTPYLAARLTNVRYTPVAHERSGFTNSSFFVDGGRTNYTGYGVSFASPTA